MQTNGINCDESVRNPDRTNLKPSKKKEKKNKILISKRFVINELVINNAKERD